MLPDHKPMNFQGEKKKRLNKTALLQRKKKGKKKKPTTKTTAKSWALSYVELYLCFARMHRRECT